ncbi:unnamed protein product [Amoebophrya sp. A25]|nr:unnamed protein product [Amoebophrya sp. A25]|eukprot:GSA25T00001412001.1
MKFRVRRRVRLVMGIRGLSLVSAASRFFTTARTGLASSMGSTTSLGGGILGSISGKNMLGPRGCNAIPAAAGGASNASAAASCSSTTGRRVPNCIDVATTRASSSSSTGMPLGPNMAFLKIRRPVSSSSPPSAADTSGDYSSVTAASPSTGATQLGAYVVGGGNSSRSSSTSASSGAASTFRNYLYRDSQGHRVVADTHDEKLREALITQYRNMVALGREEVDAEYKKSLAADLKKSPSDLSPRSPSVVVPVESECAGMAGNGGKGSFGKNSRVECASELAYGEACLSCSTTSTTTDQKIKTAATAADAASEGHAAVVNSTSSGLDERSEEGQKQIRWFFKYFLHQQAEDLAEAESRLLTSAAEQSLAASVSPTRKTSENFYVETSMETMETPEQSSTSEQADFVHEFPGSHHEKLYKSGVPAEIFSRLPHQEMNQQHQHQGLQEFEALTRKTDNETTVLTPLHQKAEAREASLAPFHTHQQKEKGLYVGTHAEEASLEIQPHQGQQQVLLAPLLSGATVVVDSVAILSALHVPGWRGHKISVKKLDAGLTNKLFRVTNVDVEDTVLFRIYGRGVSAFYDPEGERHIFEFLSDNKKIGPKLIAKGSGWRIEEWLPGTPVATNEMGNRDILEKVAEQVARFHGLEHPEKDMGQSVPSILRWLRNWSTSGEAAWKRMREMAADLYMEDDIGGELTDADVTALAREAQWLAEYLEDRIESRKKSQTHTGSHASETASRDVVVDGLRSVFCHNDVQENNLMLVPGRCAGRQEEQHQDVPGGRGAPEAEAQDLVLRLSTSSSSEEKRSTRSSSFSSPSLTQSRLLLRMIDFEYADINLAAYDLANFWNEFVLDYNITPEDGEAVTAVGFRVDFENRLTPEGERAFVRKYLENLVSRAVPLSDQDVDLFVEDTHILQLASNLIWGFWSLMRAETSPPPSETGFDFVAHGVFRFREYYQQKKKLQEKVL